MRESMDLKEVGLSKNWHPDKELDERVVNWAPFNEEEPDAAYSLRELEDLEQQETERRRKRLEKAA
jgi:hypothetical protein